MKAFYSFCGALPLQQKNVSVLQRNVLLVFVSSFSFPCVPRDALSNSECKKVNYITPNLRFIELEVLSSCFVFGLF